MRERAKPAIDKLQRRSTILAATESLLCAQPDRSINMAEVAARAGIAKGTVYLYFPSKEELLLALHESHVDAFFDHMDARLREAKAPTFDDVLAVIRANIIEHPTYLTLVNRCMDILGRGIPLDKSFAFKQRVANRVTTTGALLELRFALRPGADGVSILMHTHALVLGLWQMLRPLPELDALYTQNQFTFFQRDYFFEFSQSFRALWLGSLNH